MITSKTDGSSPETNYNSSEEQLLIAAWAYGLKSGDTIHRLSLYAFIQSHLANKTEENLQKGLETNFANWTSKGSGIYTLTDRGYNQLTKYGQPNFILPKNSSFTFTRRIKTFDISVTVDTENSKYIPKENGYTLKAKQIVETIEIFTNDKVITSQTSVPRQILNWVLRNNDYTWQIDNFAPLQNISETGITEEIVIPEQDTEQLFLEGKEKYILHKSKERNSELVASKKHSSATINDKVPCEICGFSFMEKYGTIGLGFIEAHHILPLSELEEETETGLNDLILVCSNCHKMIHRKRPWLTVDEIKSLLDL